MRPPVATPLARSSRVCSSVRDHAVLVCAVVALAAGAACKEAPPKGAGPTPQDTARAREDVAAVLRLEQARVWPSPEWDRLLTSPSAQARVALAHAIGRAALGDGIARLVKLLWDAEPAVRRAAAFGIGCYEQRRTDEAGRRLLDRLFEETDGSVVAAIVLAFGRTGADPAHLVIQRALSHFLLEVREAAGLAAGRLAGVRRGRSQTLAPALLAALEQEKEPAPRVAMAFALSRLGLQPPPALLEDRDPLVRFFAVTAAGKQPTIDVSPLRARVSDEDWRVRVAALGAVGRAGAGGVEALVEASRQALAELTASAASQKSERVQVVLAVLDALTPRTPEPITSAVRTALEAIHRATQVGRQSTLSPQALHTYDGVNCAAARALDIADGLPKRVLACAEARAFDWQRNRLAAQVLARTQARPPFERLPALAALARDRDPRVRAAAAEAMGPMWYAPGTRALALEGLRSRDPGALSALYEILGERGGRDAEMEAAVLAGAPYLRSGRDAEAMASLAAALAMIGSPKSAPTLQKLGADPVRAVAEAARKAYVRLYPADPDLPEARPPMKEHPPAVPADSGELTARVTTSKGTFDLRLRPADAPLTVGNFVALTRQGFYANQLIHRVVPAFVAQMGDPRGDGTGGPGYALPCELNPTRFRRGSVGMALAGRDTGGSQFFVTQTETPHLDGAYTNFGDVVRGMEVVDALVEGDSLVSVTLIEGK